MSERTIPLGAKGMTREQEVLEALRMEFDQHLACLSEPDAADRMWRAAEGPLKVDGRFRVSDSH